MKKSTKGLLILAGAAVVAAVAASFAMLRSPKFFGWIQPKIDKVLPPK